MQSAAVAWYASSSLDNVAASYGTMYGGDSGNELSEVSMRHREPQKSLLSGSDSTSAAILRIQQSATMNIPASHNFMFQLNSTAALPL